jgi:1-acyl-sn-glycerol-3-phosphate acyltransferase
MIRTTLALFFFSLFVLFVGPALMLFTLLTGRKDVLFRGGRRCGIWTLGIAGVRTRAVGLENIPRGTCLFAANHVSNTDPPAIVAAIPRRVAIVAKESLFSIPIVGPAFRMGGFVPVDRSNSEKALDSIKLAASRIEEGLSFLVFPEGTRSSDGRLQPFKQGVFRMAVQAGIPVVPVACAGAQRILPKDSFSIRPGEMVVRFCPPIDTTAYVDAGIAGRNELARRVHDAIAEALPEEQKPLS